jgi:hypothetical protein
LNRDVGPKEAAVTGLAMPLEPLRLAGVCRLLDPGRRLALRPWSDSGGKGFDVPAVQFAWPIAEHCGARIVDVDEGAGFGVDD